MIKTLNNTIKQDRTAYKIPRSVQDVIPIQRIFADGIFQFGTDICINNHDEMTVTLLGGLKFTELI